MATTTSAKHTCDRCGNTLTMSCVSYPKNWQHITLGQTGVNLDLCSDCNLKLCDWLSLEGATTMHLATHNIREVL